MTDSPSSATPKISPPSDAAMMKTIISSVKTQLGAMNTSFDTMAKQMGQMGVEVKLAKYIEGLGKSMKSQDQKYKALADGLHAFLTNELRAKVEKDLRIQIEKAVDEQIDGIVEQQVAATLEVHMPKKLQDELAEDKRKLDELQRKLHNS